jgi:hypothetical protein
MIPPRDTHPLIHPPCKYQSKICIRSRDRERKGISGWGHCAKVIGHIAMIPPQTHICPLTHHPCKYQPKIFIRLGYTEWKGNIRVAGKYTGGREIIRAADNGHGGDALFLNDWWKRELTCTLRGLSISLLFSFMCKRPSVLGFLATIVSVPEGCSELSFFGRPGFLLLQMGDNIVVMISFSSAMNTLRLMCVHNKCCRMFDVRTQFLKQHYGWCVSSKSGRGSWAKLVVCWTQVHYQKAMYLIFNLIILLIFLRRKVPGQTGARTRDLWQHRLALCMRGYIQTECIFDSALKYYNFYSTNLPLLPGGSKLVFSFFDSQHSARGHWWKWKLPYMKVTSITCNLIPNTKWLTTWHFDPCLDHRPIFGWRPLPHPPLV